MPVAMEEEQQVGVELTREDPAPTTTITRITTTTHTTLVAEADCNNSRLNT